MSRPTLRVVRGVPTAEELAAVTALVTAAGAEGAPSTAAEPTRGRWNDPVAAHRRGWSAGPGGWRAAAR
jgi:hypothetical protein